MTPSAAVAIVAYVGFAIWGLVLAVIDARTHRLPNRIVLPAYPAAVALLTAASALDGSWPRLLTALIGGGGMFAFYLALRLLSPGAMGGGDVKLAGVIGLMLGWLGWDAMIAGLVAAFLLGGTYGGVLLALRRATARTRIPFGPWMIVGAWAGIIVAWPPG